MDSPKSPSSPTGPAAGPAAARASHPATPDALPPGTRLDEYQIDRVLHSGGFSIVYLATDVALERVLAIEEYLPAPIAVRGVDLQVVLRSDMHAQAYERGLRAFTEEAELLARCDHPSLLRVYRGWQANGTAYRAMPYYAGTSLRQLREAMVEPPDEASMRALLDGLLGALEALHQAGGVHRGVSPDSIILGADDRPVLLGFDAARRAIVGDRAQALMSLVEPMFVTREQIGQTAEAQPGPWTDLYALAAVVRYCVDCRPATGARLDSADESLTAVMRRISARFPGLRYSPAFIDALDWALSPQPQDRPQSAAEFRAALEGQKPAAPAQHKADAAPVAPAPLRAVEPESKAADEPSADGMPADVRAAIDRALAAVDAVERPPRAVPPVSKAPERPAVPRARAASPPATAAPAAAPDDPDSDAGLESRARPAQPAGSRYRQRQQRQAPSKTVSPPPVAPAGRKPVTPPAAPPVAGDAASTPMPHIDEPLPWRPGDLEPAMYAESDHDMSEYRPLAPPRGSVAGAIARFGVAVLMLAALVAGGWKLNEMGAFEEAMQTLADMGVPIGQESRSGGLAGAGDAAAGGRGSPTSNSASVGGSSVGIGAGDVPATATGVDAAEAALARAEAVTAAAARQEPSAAQGAQPGAAAATSAAAAAAMVTPADPPPAPSVVAAPERSNVAPPVPPAPAAAARSEVPEPARSAAELERRQAVQRAEERDRQEAARRAAAVRAQRTPAAAAPAEPPRAEVAEADPTRVFSSPRAACEPRTEFSLYRCMQMQCERTQWFQHPQCIRLRLRDEID